MVATTGAGMPTRIRGGLGRSQPEYVRGILGDHGVGCHDRHPVQERLCDQAAVEWILVV